jgi:hypothetical protein
VNWQAHEELPDQRQSLVGADVEGEEVVLIRAISRKPYRCPNCGREVEIGSEHVVVRRSHPARDIKHTHWHRACVDDALRYTLRNLHPIPATQSTESALDQRYSRGGRSNRVRRR